MPSFLTLFHCDTPYGNRMHEERFQSFVVSDRANQIQRIEVSELEQIIKWAKNEPWNNSESISSLTNMLVTSLGREPKGSRKRMLPWRFDGLPVGKAHPIHYRSPVAGDYN
jgi:hypothetical protein